MDAGLSAIRPYPSAAPVQTPSNSASTARICGNSSSDATKCISDVPGFAKHTSTPEATSAPSRACAPFIVSRLQSIEHLARVQDAVGVERGLHAPHECELDRILELEKVGTLVDSDPVLAGDDPAEGQSAAEHLEQGLVPLSRVALEHR